MKLGFDIAIFGSFKSTSRRLEQPFACKYGPSTRHLYVLTYVMSGRGYYEVNDKKFALSKGDSFLVYPGTKVKYYPDSEDKWEYMWVDFNGDKAEEILECTSLTANNPVLYANENNIYEKFCELSDLFENYSKKNYHIYSLEYKSKFYALLAEYIRRYPTSNEQEVVLKNRILNYIHKKYSEPTFSVKDIEEKFSMSTAVLYRYFNKNFGITPKKYINELRIEKATYLLHKEDMTVKDAALSVGFKDPLYFSKVFKEKTGINPSEYYDYFIEKENKLI